MIKKMIIVVILFFINAQFVFSGEFIVTTKKLVPNEKIFIEYTADGRFFINEELYAFIYAFDAESSIPTAYDLKLNYHKDDLKYHGTFTLPEDVIFALIKISNGDTHDDNRRKFWEIIFHGSDGKPLPLSNLKAGLSYLGNQPENYNRSIDFKKAQHHLITENVLYPKNIQTQIGYISLRLDLHEITFEKYTEKIKKIISRQYKTNNENEVRAVSRALKTLNKNDEAEKLEKQFAKKHPKSKLAEELLLANLAKVKSFKEFSEKILIYLKKFPKSENRERIFSALVSGSLQNGNVAEMLSLLEELENVPAVAYAQIAFAIINDEELLEDFSQESKLKDASEIMKTALLIASNARIDYKLKYLTIPEWEKRNRLRYASLLEQYGQILMSSDKFREAYLQFSKAIRIFREDTPLSLYENTIELCIKLEKDNLAYKTALAAVKSSYFSEPILENLKKLHKEINNTDDYESMLIKLKSEAKRKRMIKLKFDRLNKLITLGTVKSIDGKELNLAEFKDKVIILQFWSTWCGPCTDAISSFDALAEKYNTNNNVIFLMVNIWEEGKDIQEKINDYFKENKPQIPIYIDEKNTLPVELGIAGLPITYYIGKGSKIQFIEKGFTYDEKFIKESEDRIELLINTK